MKTYTTPMARMMMPYAPISRILVASIFFLLISNLFQHGVKSQVRDLPNPQANIELVKAGSYIIGMDNFTQARIAPFNMKAYGLANALLQNEIPLKWAIRSGKQKDQKDFSAVVDQVFPTVMNGGWLFDFKAGPFIIPVEYTTQANPVIMAFGNMVNVFKTRNDILVDVRYTLTHKPTLVVCSNGGNEKIHKKILDFAQIPDYQIMLAGAIIDSNNCFTFASEPHWDSDKDADTAEAHAVVDFVNSGGNFFAQCAGVRTYCHFDTFTTTLGMMEVNRGISAHQYFNADLAIMQFEGEIKPGEGGSMKNWRADTRVNSTLKPTTYRTVCDRLDSNLFVATGAKIKDAQSIGGNVFYLGSHDYYSENNIQMMNAMRYYLNGAFIPAIRSDTCYKNFGNLPVRMSEFDGEVMPDKIVSLRWTTLEEKNTNRFDVERSVDGLSYVYTGSVGAAGNSSDKQDYNFQDEAGQLSGKVYYRLKMVDLDGSIEYSNILSFYLSDGEEGILEAWPNPILRGNEFNINYYLSQNKSLTVSVTDLMGREVLRHNQEYSTGENQIRIQTQNLEAGTYIVIVRSFNRQDRVNVVVF